MKKRGLVAAALAATLLVGACAGPRRSDRTPAARTGSHAVSSPQASSSSYVTGSPVKGSSSVSVTSASLNARKAPAATHIRVEAQKTFTPKSWTARTSFAHAASTSSAQGASPSVVAQTVSANFLGAQFVTDSNAVPPDSMGAAGPTQFLVAVNGRVRTFTKSTTTADGVLNMTLDSFFSAVGGTTNGTSDPRVRYDRTTGLWFITAIDTPTSGANHVLLAVSNTGTITPSTAWHFFTIPANANTFNDFDTLGVDEDALYIGVNVFDMSQTFVNTTAYVVRKTSVVGSGPIVYTKFANLIDMAGTGVGPYAPMGVDNFDTNTNAGYIVGIDASSSGQLDFRRINNPAGTPSISSTIVVPTADTNVPAPVPQPGTAVTLDGGELPTLSNAVIRDGRMWTSHNIEVNTAGVATNGGGRDAVRWYELQNLGGTPSVRQTGTIFDPTVTNPMNYWMPSVMVSGQGNAAFGFSRAGTDPTLGFAGAATAGRLATDALGSLGAPALYQSSAATYAPAGDTANPKRWGDFSYTSLDPSDDMTMWTVQEYTSAADTWGVRVAKLLAPAPTIGSVDQVVTGATGTTITVNGTGFYQPPSVALNHFTAAITGGVTVNSVMSVGPTQAVLNVSTVGVTPGPQTLTVTNPDGQTATAPVTVGAAAAACTSCTDFNGDGKPDILWHNTVTGDVAVWLMNGTQYTTATVFGGRTNVPLPWRPVATGDFNGDGKPDILWHNTVTGDVAVWLMNGTQYISAMAFSGRTNIPPPWRPVATGDFNGDGKTDILWHNTQTGQVAVWLMDGTQYVSATYFTGRTAVPAPWRPIATGDFNGDGKPDILWDNTATGTVAVWLMDGTQYLSATGFSGRTTVAAPWLPVATGDYNGDGKTDILWRNAADGTVAAWLMDGTQYVSATTFSGRTSIPAPWLPIV